MRLLLLGVLFMSMATAQVTLTAENGPDGSVICHVRNDRSSAITAHVIRDKTRYEIFDHLLGGSTHGKLIPPGQTFDQKIAKGAAANEWKFVAAVFEDGTTFGDAQTIADLLETRQLTYRDIDVAVQMLRDGKSIADFEGWAKSMPQAKGPIYHGMVAWWVIRYFKQDRAIPEILDRLQTWRDQLAQSKPPIPTTPLRVQGVPGQHPR